MYHAEKPMINHPQVIATFMGAISSITSHGSCLLLGTIDCSTIVTMVKNISYNIPFIIIRNPRISYNIPQFHIISQNFP